MLDEPQDFVGLTSRNVLGEPKCVILNPLIVCWWEGDDCKSCTERDYERVKMGDRGFLKLLLTKLINLGNNPHLFA